MANLKLWGRASAFNVQKALWLLHELGLEFEHEQVGGGYGGLDDPAFLRMNPHGRVPVLRDGNTIAIPEASRRPGYQAPGFRIERAGTRDSDAE